jgi:hypothetical protein
MKDVHSLAMQFESISFSHIYREANFAADAAASLGHSCQDLQLWMNCLPVHVLQAHKFDFLSIGCNRGFRL